MKPGTNRLILIFISITIVATIGLQLRWNVRNYHENRQRLLNEIQIAFDAGVENYFADKTKKDILIFADSVHSKFPNRIFKTIDTCKTELRVTKLKVDRLFDSSKKVVKIFSASGLSQADLNVRAKIPDGKTREVMTFTNRIVAAMLGDSINMSKLDRDISKELTRKGITIGYHLERFEDDMSRHPANPGLLNILARSTYLPPYQNIRFSYSDPTSLALKRSSTEIILSLLLSLSVIFCLLYLLHIINRQKKIDEIRNDLISNITHEFKTPITTISSAIEGIRDFNDADDKEKTNRYLDISQRQLGKLGIMVEKLLETATLDTDALVLNPKENDLVALLKSIVEKYRLVSGKEILFICESDAMPIKIDAFHIENAISNLVDNAVKYGGNEIEIRLAQRQNGIEIRIEDNGNGIAKPERERIFEKFYRIPKGNVHDVKGFGIGLYYSRKIIEKHGGTLELVSDPEKTVFKIALPYA